MTKLTYYILVFYTVQFLAGIRVCEAQRIFWTESNTGRIVVGNLVPTGINNATALVTGLNFPNGISIDPDNFIFYTEDGGESLVRRNYDGTSPLVLRDNGSMTGFVHIFYSKNAGGIFGTLFSEESGGLFVPEVGGSEQNLPLGSQGNDDFRGVTVHDGNEQVFLISEDDDVIYVTDFSGSGASPISVSVSGLEYITVDEQNNRLYFTGYAGGAYVLYSTALNGSGLTTVVSSSNQIMSVRVYPKFNKVYYVAGSAIFSVNPDGTNNTQLLNLPSAGISEIAIEADNIQPGTLSFNPVVNATVAPTLSELTIRFNEPIKISSDASVTGADVIEIFEDGVPLTPTISRSSAAISIDNSASIFEAKILLPFALNQARNYTVRIGAHVFEDLSGNDFPGLAPNVWNFVTQCTSLAAGTATGDHSLCAGGDPAVVRGGVAAGGNGTYQFEWESSTTSSTSGFTIISGADGPDYDPPANISVTTYFRRTVKSSNCPLATGNVVTVTVTPLPVINTHPVARAACEFESVVFNVAATGTSLGYRWEADTGNGFNALTTDANYSGTTTNQLTIANVSGLNGARYRCVVSSSGNCPVPSNIAVLTVNTLPVAVDQAPPPLCETTPGSGTAVFDLTTIEQPIKNNQVSVTVMWFLDGSFTMPVPSPSTATVSDGTVMYARLEHSSTGCRNQGKAVFRVTNAPVANASPASPTICSGAFVNVSLTGATSYSWTVTSTPGVTGASAGSGTTINQQLTNTTSVQQVITYLVTPSSNGCSGLPLNVPVTIQPLPSVFNVTGGGSFCSGQTGVTVGLSNSQAGFNYELMLNNQPTGITASPGGGAFNFTPVTAAGTYTIRAQSANCSAFMSGSASVQISSVPSGNGVISGIPSLLCPQQSGTFTVSGIIGATSYVWTVPAGFSADPSTGATITVTAGNGPAGLLKVTGENQCGAGSTAQLAIQVLLPPVVTINLPGETFADEEIAFSFTPSSGPAIQSANWVFGDGGEAAGLEVVHRYNEGGTYPVVVQVVGNNGCTGETSTSLSVRPKAGLTDFSIKNVVTANGDEKNAYLYISDIHKFPDNEVILIDRWGVEVFRANGYNNNWDLTKDGKYLPAGNYICIVKVKGRDEVLKRAITVINGK